jgi:hypothetical protein
MQIGYKGFNYQEKTDPGDQVQSIVPESFLSVRSKYIFNLLFFF